MTLFRELLNKTNQRYHIRLGAPIRSKEDATSLTPKIRSFVVSDLKKGKVDFDT